MKNIILILVASLPFAAFSQTFKKDDLGKSTNPKFPAYLLDTVVTSEYSKQQLYSNALRFVTANFKDSRNVVEMKDAELGEIAINAYTEVGDTNLSYKCKIYVKENKFKIVLSALHTAHVAFMPEVKSSLVATYDDKGANTKALALTVNVIKDIALQINRKPENDF